MDELTAFRTLHKQAAAIAPNMRDYTYRDLHRLTNRFANLLRNLELHPGARVFVLAGRIPELYGRPASPQLSAPEIVRERRRAAQSAGGDVGHRSLRLDVLSSIAPELDTAMLRPDQPLREQVDLDSFDFLNVLIALNERLGVEVPETDYAKVQTLNAMVDYFARLSKSGCA